jgi:hypothetical protein
VEVVIQECISKFTQPMTRKCCCELLEMLKTFGDPTPSFLQLRKICVDFMEQEFYKLTLCVEEIFSELSVEAISVILNSPTVRIVTENEGFLFFFDNMIYSNVSFFLFYFVFSV